MPYIEKDFPIEKLNEIASKEGNAKKPIYQIHKWWARRLGCNFRMLILSAFTDDNITEEELWRRFYSKNQLKNKDGKPPLILDPFMGGGTTIVEALRLGCRVIGIDLNPVAWFVTKKEIDPIDFDKLDSAFKYLEKTVAPKIKHYYQTRCPRRHNADIMYVFWVKKVPCTNCKKEVRLFPSFRIATKNDNHTVFCPHCYHIINADLLRPKGHKLIKLDLDKEITCPECNTKFIPGKGYSSGGKYICQHCGQKDNVLNSIKLLDDPPPLEMFAIEYFCKICGRGYKTVDDEDKNVFEEAKEEFDKRKDRLLFPRQLIPTEGRSDPRPVNYNYKYFYQMFNERQLLCLSMLLEEILKIEDENTKEYLLLALSNCLDGNNIFARYNMKGYKLEEMFSRHAYWPTNMPCEGNVWGTHFGKGSFINRYSLLRKAKDYWFNPEGLNELSDMISNNFLHNPERITIRAHSSEDLTFIRANSIDAVITDPPYHSNVMYAELADFFYVWLKIALNDKYPYFQSELTPKSREIVKNEIMDKDDNFFMEGLTRIFSECNRVLSNNGLFVFTFHHREGVAWKQVLRSIVQSGFYVVSVYPIHAEMKTSTHIMEGGISYDIPFVCRKRIEESKPIAWEKLKDEIFFRAQETVNKIKKDPKRSISDSDLFVIVMGRCLELYSKHYPNVMKAGKTVDVDEAVDDIQEIVDSLIKSFELKQLPAGIDNTTKLYLLYIAGKTEISFDEINKRIQTGGGDVNEFFKRNYIRKKGRKLIVTPAQDRFEYLKKIDKSAPFTSIDAAHYLFVIYEKGESMAMHLDKLSNPNLGAVLELLYKKTGNRTYSKIAEQLRSYLTSGRQELFSAPSPLEEKSLPRT